MKLVSFGHACWLIETCAGRILTDPVLADPFEGGTGLASSFFLRDAMQNGNRGIVGKFGYASDIFWSLRCMGAGSL